MFKIGLKYKTDKITHHGYHRFYDYFLIPYKHKHFNFFEIGINTGRSLRTWNDFFTNAKIYGMDIDHEYDHERGKIFKGDQSKKTHLAKIVKAIKTSEFIIDDGSHVPEHQLLTFNYFFKNLLEFGGVYIIEDIETSYWRNSELYGYKIDSGYDKPNSIVKIFRDVVDIVNREFLTDDDKKIINKLSQIEIDNLKYISFIMFGQNCIIIKKMSMDEYKRYGERKYRFIASLGPEESKF